VIERATIGLILSVRGRDGSSLVRIAVNLGMFVAGIVTAYFW